MLVLTSKYGSQIDIDLLKKQKEQTKEPLIKHRLTIDLNEHNDIKNAYLAFLTNKDKYFIGYKPKDSIEIRWFILYSLGEIDTLNVSWIDVSELNSLSECFRNCQVKHIIGLENWNVSGCTDMNSMFYGCKKLESIGDISWWDVSNVRYMTNMFMTCEQLKSIDLSMWDVSNVEKMAGMFYECKNIESIGDISGWNIMNVNDMGTMFCRCYKLESIDISRLDVSNVNAMDYMFKWCEKLKNVGDLSGWDVSNIERMYEMFKECKNLKDIGDLEQWNLPFNAGTNNMFKNSAITPIPSWYTKR